MSIRHFGIQGGPASLGGTSADRSAYGASTRSDSQFDESGFDLSQLELGARFFSIAVIALPAAILLGIYLAYRLYVLLFL